MRAEIARRFPDNQVEATSREVTGKTVAIRAASGHRLAIRFAADGWERTPDEVEQAFKGWLEEGPAQQEARGLGA